MLNKRYFIKGFLLTAVILLQLGSDDTAQAQTNVSHDQNFVLTTVPRVAGYDPSLTGYTANDAMQAIQYIDGLGRLLQTVQIKGSPGYNDVVQPVAYDAYGREVIKYLPYANNPAIASDGSYKTDALTQQGNFYNAATAWATNITTTLYPSSGINYEPSPLNRPVEQGAPGADWQLGSGHTVRMGYTVNVAGDVPMWVVTAGGASWGTSYYRAGTLAVDTVTDENGHNSVAYTDRFKRTLCKKVNNNGTWLMTCYVYDDLGNLAYVVPPVPGSYPTAFTESDPVFNNFIYAYRYDDRNRVTKKKLPGKGWEYLAYNTLDQVVATQDSVQKGNNQWVFTKYDGQGRVVMTGIWNNGGTAINQGSLQTSLNSQTTLWETAQNSGNGYTVSAWPATNIVTTLMLNYYDNYSLIPGLPATYSAPVGASTMTTGLLTASQVNVLGTVDMLWSVNYYDDLGRTLQNYRQHYLGASNNTGMYNVVTNAYDFSNEVTSDTLKHFTTYSSTTPIVGTVQTYVYDHMGRKLQSWEQIGIGYGPRVLLSQTDYNETGQVINKHLHSADGGASFFQDIAYSYNERGWLTQTSAPLFAMQLKYNNGTVPQYNGNIANQYWGTPGSLANSYNYSYDPLNRLVSGIANTGNTEKSIVYDNLGNIMGLQRWLNVSGTSTKVDALNYSYQDGSGNLTNRLYAITDSTTSNLGLKSGTGWAYQYDGNGNLTYDQSKGLSITYNILNLPQANTLTGGTVTYTYDATGRKLRKVNTIGTGTQTDYVDGLQYENGYYSFLQTEEGRALYNNTNYTYDYEYNLSDHLGNVRLSFDTKTGTADTTQRDDYLPFGMEVSKYVLSPKNEHLYNKKELQEELGQYDYGARFYDPVIARWNTVDPLAEISRRWSPYNYVENDPIRLTDPDGMAGKLDILGQRAEDEAAMLENKKLIADMKAGEQDMAALAAGGNCCQGLLEAKPNHAAYKLSPTTQSDREYEQEGGVAFHREGGSGPGPGGKGARHTESLDITGILEILGSWELPGSFKDIAVDFFSNAKDVKKQLNNKKAKPKTITNMPKSSAAVEPDFMYVDPVTHDTVNKQTAEKRSHGNNNYWITIPYREYIYNRNPNDFK